MTNEALQFPVQECKLSQVEAEQLVVTLCPRIEEYAAELVTICEYEELALKISAGLLADEKHISISAFLLAVQEELAYLQYVRVLPMISPVLEAVLNLAYEALGADEQQAFAAAGVFRAGFDTQSALEILFPGTKVPGFFFRAKRERFLEMLCRRNLLVWDETAGLYMMPQTVQSFAAAHMVNPYMVHLRYARYYVQKARRIGERIHEELQRSADIPEHEHSWFNQEFFHIEHAWTWTLSLASFQESDQLIVDFTLACKPMTGVWYDIRNDRIPRLHQAVEAARRLGKQKPVNVFLEELGTLYTQIGDTRSAIACYEQRLPHRTRSSILLSSFFRRSQPAMLADREVETPERVSWSPWFFLAVVVAAEMMFFFSLPHAGLLMYILLLAGLYTYAVAGRFDAIRQLAVVLTLLPLVRIIGSSLLFIPLEDIQQVSLPLQSTEYLLKPLQSHEVAMVRSGILSFLMLVALLIASRYLPLEYDGSRTYTRSPLFHILLVVAGVEAGMLAYLSFVDNPFVWHLLVDQGWLLILLLPLVSGATEELMFRGVLQSAARPVLGAWMVLYVSLLFAGMHLVYLSWQSVALAFLLGYGFSAIVYWSRSVISVMFLHGLLNVLVLSDWLKIWYPFESNVGIFSPGLEQLGGIGDSAIILLSVISLIVIVVLKEIFQGMQSIRARKINQALDIAIYPFVLAAISIGVLGVLL
jgi:hypothetical protein